MPGKTPLTSASACPNTTYLMYRCRGQTNFRLQPKRCVDLDELYNSFAGAQDDIVEVVQITVYNGFHQLDQIFNDEKGLPKPKKYEWIVWMKPGCTMGVAYAGKMSSDYWLFSVDPANYLCDDVRVLIGKREVQY